MEHLSGASHSGNAEHIGLLDGLRNKAILEVIDPLTGERHAGSDAEAI